MNDELGKRMKDSYESRTQSSLLRRSYTIIRLDGKAFHTLTHGFNKPFDHDLMDVMDQTTVTLCEQIQGVVLAYTQSDEISLLLTDFATPQTNAWYDGNIQKIVSVSASIATLAFNKAFNKKALDDYMAQGFKKGKFYGNDGEILEGLFDSRVFTIADPTEVENYFIWRQNDAVRNSIQGAAQSVYSQKQLHGKNGSQLQEMLFQKGINWDKYTSGEKRGRAVMKEKYVLVNKTKTLVENGPMPIRTRWVVLDGTDVENDNETPTFTADRAFLRSRIPLIGTEEDE